MKIEHTESLLLGKIPFISLRSTGLFINLIVLFLCRELKAARVAQAFPKDPSLERTRVQESGIGLRHQNTKKRLVGGKNTRSFSFTASGYRGPGYASHSTN